jgi:hypothetical protein
LVVESKEKRKRKRMDRNEYVRFFLRGSKKKGDQANSKKKRGIMWWCGQVYWLQRDTGFSANCRYGCTQLIWFFGVQESVLLVMGDMLGVFSNCI